MNLKQANIEKAYTGFSGPDTFESVKSFIPEELNNRLTGMEIGLVMNAINNAYHAGKQSCGCEIVNGDCIWIDQIQKLVPIDEIEKIITEDEGGL